MSILDQAFLWDSADQANYAVTHELGDLIQTKANEHGIHVIGYMESGFVMYSPQSQSSLWQISRA